MRKIKGESTEISAVAQLIYEFSSMLKQKQSIMENINKDLITYWQGDDAKKFSATLEKEIINIGKFATNVEDYANFLNYVGQGFDAIESDYGKKINVPKGG